MYDIISYQYQLYDSFWTYLINDNFLPIFTLYQSALPGIYRGLRNNNWVVVAPQRITNDGGLEQKYNVI